MSEVTSFTAALVERDFSTKLMKFSMDSVVDENAEGFDSQIVGLWYLKLKGFDGNEGHFFFQSPFS